MNNRTKISQIFQHKNYIRSESKHVEKPIIMGIINIKKTPLKPLKPLNDVPKIYQEEFLLKKTKPNK
ncbi:MAG: hypothetical protein N2B06_04840 [Clostridium sp.]